MPTRDDEFEDGGGDDSDLEMDIQPKASGPRFSAAEKGKGRPAPKTKAAKAKEVC